MKIRNFIFALLAMAGLAVSCTKSEVGGETPPLEEEAPVAIQLSTNIKVNEVSVTKAGVDSWNAQTLYIYALPTNEIPTEGNEKILVNNAPAAAPSGAYATADPYALKDITLYNDSALETFYYYPADKSTLDFYGYYVDDAFKEEESGQEKPQPVITQNDKISLKLYLDGSQDIMLAKADKIADTQNIEDAPGTMIAPANAYSAYSARKGVKPNLKFQHLLSRFVFNVVAGNDEGKNVNISEVTLTSLSQANLVIASVNGATGIADAAVDGIFKLEGTTDHPLPCYPGRKVDTQGSYTIESTDRIGESIMVIPAPMHKMVMKMQQKDNTRETDLGDPFEYVYELTPSMVTNASAVTEFLPGYQYNVNVVVYGREKVEVQVTLTEWAAGGSITIDNDKEWGDEPKLGLKATKDNTDYYLYFYGSPIVAKTDETPGTEVKVWNQATNKMEPAPEGTYKFFAVVQETIWYVTLEREGEGETLKTVVTGLFADDPTTPTT